MRFKDPAYNDLIYGYDIYNEPAAWVKGTNHVPHRWREMAPEIIRAIRAIDRDVWIIYQPGPWNGPDNYRDLKPLADQRVMYSLHFYLPGGFTHQGVNKASREEAFASIGVEYPGTVNGKVWARTTLERELQLVDEFQRRYNLPILPRLPRVGRLEFGVPRGHGRLPLQGRPGCIAGQNGDGTRQSDPSGAEVQQGVASDC